MEIPQYFVSLTLRAIYSGLILGLPSGIHLKGTFFLDYLYQLSLKLISKITYETIDFVRTYDKKNTKVVSGLRCVFFSNSLGNLCEFQTRYQYGLEHDTKRATKKFGAGRDGNEKVME